MNNTTTFLSTHKPSKNLGNAGLSCYMNTSYKNIVRLLGESTIRTDEYKTCCEWHVEVYQDDQLTGAVAIYDYKECKTYRGEHGLEKEHITTWHVGAKDHKLAAKVVNFIAGSKTHDQNTRDED